MAFVLSIIAILAILIGLLFQLILNSNQLALSNQDRAQAGLLTHAAANYWVFRLRETEPHLAEWQSRDIQYTVIPNRKDFQIKGWSTALFLDGIVTGRVIHQQKNQQNLTSNVVSVRNVQIGQRFDLGQFPSLGLLNRQGNLVLAGSAQIKGPVLLWKGSVRRSTHSKMRAEPNAQHFGAVWDSSNGIWQQLEMDLAGVDAWLKNPDNRDWNQTSFKISNKLILGDSSVLMDSVMENVHIQCSGRLFIQGNSEINKSVLTANKIIIQGKAKVMNTICFAKANMLIKDDVQLGGQFIAGDSMRINMQSSLQSFPFFYVHGRILRASESDTTYLGYMGLDKVKGQGVFVFGGYKRPETDAQTHFYLGSQSDIEGFVDVRGFAQLEGRVRGTVLCENLRFESQGTLWYGHLLNAKLEQAKKGYYVSVPYIYKLVPPSILRTSG